MKKHLMEIKPALAVTERHRLEDCLKKLGYHVSGGGQMVNGTSCDISFEMETEPGEATKNETEQTGELSGESWEKEIMRLKKEVEQYKQVLKGYNTGA